MNDLKGYMISSITTHVFPSSELSYMHAAIMERIMAVPVTPAGGTDLTLHIKNNTDKDITVRSKDLVGHGVEVHYKNILLLYLHPGEEVHLCMQVTEGTGKQHVFYRRVEHVWITEDGELEIEPLKPYTAKQIFEEAVEYCL